MNPNELSLHHNGFDAVVSHINKKCVLRRVVTLKEAYDANHRSERMRPSPDLATMFSVNDIKGLGANQAQCELLEKNLVFFRQVLDKGLQKFLESDNCKHFINMLEGAIPRLGMAKTVSSFKPGTSGGAVTQDKIDKLISSWIKHVNAAKVETLGKTEDAIPELKPFLPSIEEDEASKDKKGKEDIMCVSKFSDDHQLVESLADDAYKSDLFIGGEVQLLKRITVNVGPDHFREDIPTTMIGKIVSVGVGPNNNICVEFPEVPDQNKQFHKVQAEVKPSNLQAVGPPKQKPGTKPGAPKEKDTKNTTAPPFLQQEGDESLTLLSGWDSDAAAPLGDDASKVKLLTSMVQVLCTEYQRSIQPAFKEKDLMVCVRNKKLEVWTARPFKANELVLCPCGTLRDKYWTTIRSTLIENGSSLHPEGKHLVIDGRYLSPISLDEKDKRFALFWAVTRVDPKAKASDKTAINMKLEVLPTQMTLSIDLPNHAVESKIKDVPHVKYMFNPDKIPKHTKLCVMDDVNLSKAYAKSEQEKIADGAQPPKKS